MGAREDAGTDPPGSGSGVPEDGWGDLERAEQTRKDAIVKRRTAIAATKGLSIAEVRRARAAAVAEQSATEGDGGGPSKEG